MKKLYKAEKLVTTFFISSQTYDSLEEEAADWLEQEVSHSYRIFDDVTVNEVKSLSEVPSEWITALPWGENDNDISVKEFLEKEKKEKNKKISDPEYKTYLRLKKKFKE